jgi:hypothetical protein
MDPEDVEAHIQQLTEDVQDFGDELDRVEALADSMDDEVDELPGDFL